MYKLLGIIAGVLLFLLIYVLIRKQKKLSEDFVMGQYEIDWSPPAVSPDSPVSGYNWAICSGDPSTCSPASAIQSGTTTATSAMFSSGTVGNEYTVYVQAYNAFGSGPWATLTFTAGIGSASISLTDAATGNQVLPNTTTVSISTVLPLPSGTVLATPLSIAGQYTQMRGGNIVSQQYLSNSMWTTTVSTENVSSVIPNLTLGMPLQNGDVITVNATIVDASNNLLSDATGNFPVEGSAPGAPGGISTKYRVAPPNSFYLVSELNGEPMCVGLNSSAQNNFFPAVSPSSSACQLFNSSSIQSDYSFTPSVDGNNQLFSYKSHATGQDIVTMAPAQQGSISNAYFLTDGSLYDGGEDKYFSWSQGDGGVYYLGLQSSSQAWSLGV